MNVINWTLPGSYEEFVDHIAPTLQERGLMQSEYREGTLREKLFGHPQLPDSHPAGGGAARSPAARAVRWRAARPRRPSATARVAPWR